MTTAGEKAGSNSNDYVRTTVYLTIVLFFAGIGSHFDWPFHPLRPRWFQRRTASGSHRAPSYRPEPWLMHLHSNPYFAFSRSGRLSAGTVRFEGLNELSAQYQKATVAASATGLSV